MKPRAMKVGMLVCAGMMSLAQYGHSESPDRERAAAPYIGLNYGGYKSRGDEFDDDADLIEGVVGVYISPYFGVEGSYTDFGEFGGDIVTTEIDGYGIAAIGRLPVSDSFALYVKGGYFWWDADTSVETPSGDIDGSVDGEEPFYGVGVDFQVVDHFNLSLEYLRYEFDLSDSSLPDTIDDYETDIDTVKLGAKYLF